MLLSRIRVADAALAPTPRPRSASSDLSSPTVFHEPWWLEAATGGRWSEAIVESGGRIAGRLPYLADRKRTGQISIVMPMLTRVLGPYVRVASDKDDAVRQPGRHKIVRELIDQMPRASHIWMCMHAGVTDTMPFEEAGCLTGLSWTTEIQRRAEEITWKGMRDKTRNVIRRSMDRYGDDVALDASDFLAFYADCAREAGRVNGYPPEMCGTLVGEILDRQRGRIHAVKDADGDLAAAILVVHDATSSYYLMSARRRNADNGAVSLLMWNAIREAGAAGLVFDTDGINEGNRLLITGFGGAVRPRYLVTRTSTCHSALMTAKRLLRR